MNEVDIKKKVLKLKQIPLIYLEFSEFMIKTRKIFPIYLALRLGSFFYYYFLVVIKKTPQD